MEARQAALTTPKRGALEKVLLVAKGQKETPSRGRKTIRPLKMQAEDSASYYDEAFQAELLQAYREGRVK